MTFAPMTVPKPGKGPKTGTGLPAARLGDADVHGSLITTASPNVFVELLMLARLSDMVSPCAAPIATGCSTVLVNGMLAARLSDKTACGGTITTGAKKTFIGHPGDAGDKNPADCLQNASNNGSLMVILY